MTKEKFNPVNPNAILDLKGYDYLNPDGFKGESFKKYNEMLEDLCPVLGIKEHSETSFDFELHRAEPIFVDRFPGVPNTPKDFVGIKLKVDPSRNTSLVHTTRISIKHARVHNGQIENAHSRAGHGKYYLLKKA